MGFIFSTDFVAWVFCSFSLDYWFSNNYCYLYFKGEEVLYPAEVEGTKLEFPKNSLLLIISYCFLHKLIAAIFLTP